MQTDQSRTTITLADGAGHTFGFQTGSTEGNGVRARHGRRYEDTAGSASGRGQAGTLGLRRRPDDIGRWDIAARGGRATGGDCRPAGGVYRRPARAGTGAAYPRRDDPVPRPAN